MENKWTHWGSFSTFSLATFKLQRPQDMCCDKNFALTWNPIRNFKVRDNSRPATRQIIVMQYLWPKEGDRRGSMGGLGSVNNITFHGRNSCYPLFTILFYLFYAIFKLWPQHAKKCQQTIKLKANTAGLGGRERGNEREREREREREWETA